GRLALGPQSLFWDQRWIGRSTGISRRDRRRFRGKRARHGVRNGIGLVHLEIGLDGRAELVARLLELAHGPPEGPPELGKILGTEDEQGDDEDENQLLKADVKHE